MNRSASVLFTKYLEVCLPVSDMRAGITTRQDLPGRDLHGLGCQSSTKLCIIVHTFFTILYSFPLFSSMDSQV